MINRRITEYTMTLNKKDKNTTNDQYNTTRKTKD